MQLTAMFVETTDAGNRRVWQVWLAGKYLTQFHTLTEAINLRNKLNKQLARARAA